ncbi:MAG: hypothetical protein RBR06_11470 [Desulfuromonadaceae bacterium]|nr:hypothetical protein [Desulfuromonadaceae bacterium]
MGIEEQIHKIDTNISAVSKDVTEIKSKVDKKISYEEIIDDLKSSRSKKDTESALLKIKQYRFDSMLDGDQVVKIMEHFSGNAKAEAAGMLYLSTEPEITMEQLFALLPTNTNIQEFGMIYGPFALKTSGGKIPFSNLYQYIKDVKLSTNDITLARTIFSVFCQKAENITENQKSELAELLKMDPSEVDFYLSMYE